MNQGHPQARQGTEIKPTGTLTKDTLFQLLGNRRRRWAIRYLTHNEHAQLGDLAEQIAAWEAGISAEQVTAQQRKRAYTSLQQTHLPALEEAGVIDFSVESGDIDVTEQMETLDIYLEVVPKHTIPWSVYYLGVGLVGCAVVIAITLIGTWPLTAIPAQGWALLLSLTITISGLIHTYRTHTMRLGSHTTPPEVKHNP